MIFKPQKQSFSNFLFQIEFYIVFMVITLLILLGDTLEAYITDDEAAEMLPDLDNTSVDLNHYVSIM